MCIKRIGTLLAALLGYIALAGAAQSLINHFTPKQPSERYAELRVGPDDQIQVLICKDWVLEPDNMDLNQDLGDPETGQDIYYWVNLQGRQDAGTFTHCDVYANGPVPHFSYHGVVDFGRNRNQVTINLLRDSAKNQSSGSTPCPANGTYKIRKVINGPFFHGDYL